MRIGKVLSHEHYYVIIDGWPLMLKRVPWERLLLGSMLCCPVSIYIVLRQEMRRLCHVISEQVLFVGPMKNMQTWKEA